MVAEPAARRSFNPRAPGVCTNGWGWASLGKRMVPARVRREPSVLSAAQVTQLLDATRDDPHHALWAVLTLTGLRPSEALVRHRDRQEAERLTAPRYATHDFVFADGAGEPWRADGVHKYHWLPTLARLNLPRVRLYDARHSCATTVLESGASMRVV